MREHNMDLSIKTVHRGMIAIDIASFGHPSRSSAVQAHLRSGLYTIVSEAFAASDLSWDQCYREDRGDGILIVTPPDVSTSLLVDPMILQLASGVRHHNRLSSEAAKIRLRIAVHVGSVTVDEHGMSGAAIVSLFRLLDARAFKEASTRSDTDVDLIVSDLFYDSVVRHGLSMLDPTGFLPIVEQVKETRVRGWVYIPDDPTDPPGTTINQGSVDVVEKPSPTQSGIQPPDPGR